MDRQFRQWKSMVERLWLAGEPDYLAAARLVAGIAGEAADLALRQVAAQALPGLRDATAARAGRSTKDLAWRRLSAVRDVLHALTVPRFGKRGTAAPIATSEEQHRKLLGLPSGRRLAAAEIHQAYKRAAKTSHPDGGGSAGKFQELAAAHDALMKAR